jgi:uncharacterized Tic20 family protein
METSTGSNVRTWCVLCHAAALAGIVLHVFGHFFGPLLVWLLKRDDAAEIDAHGKESVNFQLSMLLYNVIAAILCLVLIGFVLLVILWIANTVFVIIASIQAGEGKLYRYPIAIRFIK